MTGMDGALTAASIWPSRKAAAPKSLHYETAFTEAYQTYYTKLFAFIYSRVENVELTKDLTAEVFQRAYLKGHGVREAAAYASWLFAIAKNVIVGHYRRQKRENNRMERFKESLWLAEQPVGPEEAAIGSDLVGQVVVQLKTLPRRDQELLALKFEGQLTNAEIARVMRMSEVNVRVSIFRALSRLRERMAEEL